MLGPEASAVAPVLEPLGRPGGAALAPEVAAEAVLYLKRRPAEMTQGQIVNLLTYEVAVIRAEAVRTWLGRPRDDDDGILQRVFADLSRAERDALLAALDVEAEDSRWRRVVALTRAEVPDEVQAALLAPAVALDDGVAAVRAAPGEEQFAACVAVQAGDPDMLSEWRSPNSSPVWTAALKQAVADPADPLFDAAFSRALFAGARDDGGLVAMLSAAARLDADAVFRHLVARSIPDGGLHHAANWRALLGIGPADGDRSAGYDRMAEVAPEIVDSVLQLDIWISDQGHRAEIEERLKVDRAVLSTLAVLIELRDTGRRIAAYEREDPEAQKECSDVDDGEVESNMVAVMVRLVELSTPRFLDTVDTVARVLTEERLLTEEVDARLKAIREGMLPGVSAARDEYSAIERGRRPTDWVTD